MNDRTDVERVLERWFDDGPTAMPERVALVVADRIDRQRQRRPWRIPRRSTTMHPILKVSAAVAAVLVIALVGYNLLPLSPSQVGGPGTAATPSPSPTPSPPAMPDGLLDARDYVARAIPGDPMAFTITAPQGWTGLGGFFMGGPHRSGAPSGVGISFNHDPQVVSDPCDASVHTPPPGSNAPSVDDLVAALSARTDLKVSGVTDIALAGYQGKRLDLQLPATSACGNHYVFAEPKGLYSNGPSNRWRVWLLDVNGETAVVVLLDYAGTPADDRATAEAAIDSIRITP